MSEGELFDMRCYNIQMWNWCRKDCACDVVTTEHLIICLNCLNHSRGEAINHVSVSDDDEIQPATASLPSCGYAHLMTPRLQQLSHRLQ